MSLPEHMGDSRNCGTYVLVMSLATTQEIIIGKLGCYRFQTGYYAYVGSAFGTGGLRARLDHHLKIAIRPHWHIDYLRRVASLEVIWSLASDRRWEHEWAGVLGGMPNMEMLIPKFGASDCTCPTHLFYSQQLPALPLFFARLKQLFPDEAPPQENLRFYKV